MYVYNIRLELRMEIEQRHVVSYLLRKGMKLPAIVAELAAVSQEDALDKDRAKHWPHETKLPRFDLNDRASSSQTPLEDIDARILEVEPWSSVRTIAGFLKIPASTVHFHRTTSLNMKSRHFKWVPHFLDDDLRAKRLGSA
jgi:hypothetical protein